MITEAVLRALVGLAGILLNALPALDVQLDQAMGVAGLIELLALVNVVFPVRLVGQFLLIWLVLEIFNIGKRMVDFLLAKIPGIR